MNWRFGKRKRANQHPKVWEEATIFLIVYTISPEEGRRFNRLEALSKEEMSNFMRVFDTHLKNEFVGRSNGFFTLSDAEEFVKEELNHNDDDNPFSLETDLTFQRYRKMGFS